MEINNVFILFKICNDLYIKKQIFKFLKLKRFKYDDDDDDDDDDDESFDLLGRMCDKCKCYILYRKEEEQEDSNICDAEHFCCKKCLRKYFNKNKEHFSDSFSNAILCPISGCLKYIKKENIISRLSSTFSLKIVQKYDHSFQKFFIQQLIYSKTKYYNTEVGLYIDDYIGFFFFFFFFILFYFILFIYLFIKKKKRKRKRKRRRKRKCF
jgi:hypothetical protein